MYQALCSLLAYNSDQEDEALHESYNVEETWWQVNHNRQFQMCTHMWGRKSLWSAKGCGRNSESKGEFAWDGDGVQVLEAVRTHWRVFSRIFYYHIDKGREIKGSKRGRDR